MNCTVATCEIPFTTTGINNRIAIAAAIGVAMSFVGVMTFLSSLSRFKQLNRVSFCLLLGLLCSTGFIINNTLASFWVAAYRKQLDVLTDITSKFPEFPRNAHLLLDGVCTSVGPGIVFSNQWDLEDSLKIRYSNYAVKADVFRPTMRFADDGLFSSTYGVTEYHPFGENLLVYDFRKKRVYKLTDASTAKAYFETRGNSCPAASEDTMF